MTRPLLVGIRKNLDRNYFGLCDLVANRETLSNNFYKAVIPSYVDLNAIKCIDEFFSTSI